MLRGAAAGAGADCAVGLRAFMFPLLSNLAIAARACQGQTSPSVDAGGSSRVRVVGLER